MYEELLIQPGSLKTKYDFIYKATDPRLKKKRVDEIVDQLNLALQYMQIKYGFVHYDLTPWNVVLKQLDTYKRPIHCTDIKRETLYIKDNNEWERDCGNHKLKDAINDVANKQRKAIADWETNNPSWATSETGKDDYIKLVRSVMSDVNGTPNENKIIKSIEKNYNFYKLFNSIYHIW